jgi:hypothetical protein
MLNHSFFVPEGNELALKALWENPFDILDTNWYMIYTPIGVDGMEKSGWRQLVLSWTSMFFELFRKLM